MGTSLCSKAFALTFLLVPAFICSSDGKPVSEDGDSVVSENAITDRPEVAKEVGACRSDFFSDDSSGALKIISNKAWNSKRLKVEYDTRTTPVSYVVISQGGERCSNDCLTRIQELTNRTLFFHFENFFVGEDGKAYEVLGWDAYTHYDGGFGAWSVVVKFLGDFRQVSPDKTAMDAFRSLIKSGVDLGKISPDYKVISMQAVHEDETYIPDKILEELKCSDRYKNVLDNPLNHPTVGRFPIVFREEWNATKPVRDFDPVSTPIQYVMVTSYGTRCFTSYSCMAYMQNDQRRAIRSYGDVILNFYVGDDGFAYEGRGWEWVPAKPRIDTKLDLPRNLIVVAFHGTSVGVKPTNAAFVAFHKLLRFGILLGKISPNYEIVSGRILRESLVGDGLQSELSKMERYRESLPQL